MIRQDESTGEVDMICNKRLVNDVKITMLGEMRGDYVEVSRCGGDLVCQAGFGEQGQDGSGTQSSSYRGEVSETYACPASQEQDWTTCCKPQEMLCEAVQ